MTETSKIKSKTSEKNYWISRLLNCTFNDTWRRHQFKIFSALLALCEGNPSVVTGGFPSQRPVTRSFDVFFDQRLNKRSSKNRDAGDVRHHRVHCDINVMTLSDFFTDLDVSVSLFESLDENDKLRYILDLQCPQETVSICCNFFSQM